MRNIHNLAEERLSGCTTTALRQRGLSVLKNKKCVKWTLASQCADGETCQSEFTAPTEHSDFVHHLVCEITPQRERWHFSIRRAEDYQHDTETIR